MHLCDFVQTLWTTNRLLLYDHMAKSMIRVHNVQRRKCRNLPFTRNFVILGGLPYSLMSGAGPGFLEREFICIKVWGFALLNLSHFLKYLMEMK